MSKKIILSWLSIIVLVFSIYNFEIIENWYVFFAILVFSPLIPFLTIFFNKEIKIKKTYYKYGLVLPVILYYIVFFAFVWMAINAFKHFTGLG